MKATIVLIAAGAAGCALAQTPNAQMKFDLVPTYITGLGENTRFRFFDVLGHYSTVGLSLAFEQGYHAYVSERLERIDRNPDTEQLDEYYFEDPGIWRLGKQYLPFGRQGLLRESVRAARGDTRLLFRDLPVAVAICDNGDKQARGIVGRIGSVIGLSFALGNDFGAQSTDFTVIRTPESAPGPGRGYRAAVGMDFARHWGMYTVQAEGIALRNGETPSDPNTEISDLLLTIQPSKWEALTLGFSREWGLAENVFRAQGRFLVTRDVWLEPIIRIKDGEFFDLGLTLHVRL